MRKKRRTISLTVKSNGQLVISAPMAMPKDVIEKFAVSHEKWVMKIQSRYSFDAQKVLEFSEGALLYHGEKEGWQGDAKKEVYRRAEELFGRLEAFAFSIGETRCRSMKLSHSHSTWGSCSGKQTVSLNYLLVCLPPKLADYVMAHELCHLTQMNHSARFWAELSKIMPDCRERRRQLKNYAWLLRLYN